jgi:hypothetical protein
MLAFVLAGGAVVAPVVAVRWLAGIFTGATILSLKLKKDDLERCIRLGINPERLKRAEAKHKKAIEELIKKMREAGFGDHDIFPIVEKEKREKEEWEMFTEFKLMPDDLEPCLKWIAGHYCLTHEERRLQSVGMRAVMLNHREGEFAQKMLMLSEMTGVPYEDMEFLWGGVKVDFAWLLTLSQQRLKDRMFGNEVRQAKSA